jgi:hypothetical protein
MTCPYRKSSRNRHWVATRCWPRTDWRRSLQKPFRSCGGYSNIAIDLQYTDFAMDACDGRIEPSLTVDFGRVHRIVIRTALEPFAVRGRAVRAATLQRS